MLEDLGQYRDPWARTLAGDLSFPLHARVDAAGRVVILDGVHRLLKATVLGEQLVKVRLFGDEDLYATWRNYRLLAVGVIRSCGV
ncbi:hypothetical protein CKW46_07460 [Mycobacterium liflandii]|nr:hypothetical protein CKW46_07460 [Mycobacterium liflandii]